MNVKIKTVVCLAIAATLLLVFMYIYRSGEHYNESGDLIPVTLRLQWHIQTQFAGYYVALDKGFYAEQGLDVKIEQGGYGKNSLITVKEGVEEFGTKWTADLIAAGDAYMSLANIVKDNGLVLVSKKEHGITDVDQFINKTVSIWFIGNEYQLFVLLDKYGIARDKVNIIPQQWDMTQFLNDETHVSAAMVYNELLQLYHMGYSPEDLNLLSFKEKEVGFPGQNIFTSKEYYRDNPDICRGFVQASIQGWRYAIEHPEEAAGIVMKYDTEQILNKEHQIKQMKEMIKLINADQHEIGIHLDKDYAFIESVFKKYNIISQDADLRGYYTNEFVSGRR